MTRRSENPEILQLLHQEHEEVQELFEQFHKSMSTKNGQNKANSLAKQIFDDLKLHTELEEKLVYPELKEQDATVFYEAGEEHHVVDLLIEELEQMEVSAPEYSAKMTVMEENVNHHIQEEESEVFDRLRRLSAETLEKMAEDWIKQKERAQR